MKPFKVGHKVQVTDQQPPAVGVIEKISTWHEVNGHPDKGNTCYLIRCPRWEHANWIDSLFVEAI